MSTSRKYLLSRIQSLRALIDDALSAVADPLDISADWTTDHLVRLGAHRARLEHLRTTQSDDDPLVRISRRHSLCDFEEDLLVLALGPCVDRSFGRTLSRLRQTHGAGQPDVDLAMAILTDNLENRLSRLGHLDPTAPLLKHRLVELSSPRSSNDILAQVICVPLEVQSELLGIAAGRNDFPMADPVRTLKDVCVPEDERPLLESLISAPPEGGGFVLLTGPSGSGKSAIAEAVAGSMGRPMISVDCLRVSARAADLTTSLKNLLQQAAATGAVLCLEDADRLLTHRLQGTQSLTSTLEQLIAAGTLMMITTQNEGSLDPGVYGHIVLRVALGVPTIGQREVIWRSALAGQKTDSLDLPFIAEKYDFTGGQIVTAARVALAMGRQNITDHHIHMAAHGQIQHHLAQLAIRSVNHLTLHDVVLPDELKETLVSIVAAVRNRRRIFEEWGFGERLTTGKGLSMLFRGESGTGKTLSAEVLASTLGMPIYRVAIPRIVSKYIGETEENLEKAFREAQVAGAILLFDEADAIFTRRVEVSSATDRYSNMEVNLLLQELERFEGIVILTTNLDAAIDDAFERRLNFKLDFPFPGPAHRCEIWRRLLPDKAPVVLGDEDLDYLSERFELSGGSIKNVVLRAAYRAAEMETHIGIDLLESACVQEYRELGKLIADV